MNEKVITKHILLNEAISHGFSFFAAVCEEDGTEATVERYLDYQKRFFMR